MAKISRPHLNFHARTLSTEWIRAIKATTGPIIAFSPYITTCKLIDTLAAKGRACKLYTLVDPKVYASGSSNVNCLRKLFDARVRIFHVDNLHAKLLLITDEPAFVTVGSQNMTVGGEKNREATVIFKADQCTAKEVLKATENWCKGLEPIDNARVEDIEECVRKYAPQFRKWENEIKTLSLELQEKRRQEKEEQEQREAEAAATTTRKSAGGGIGGGPNSSHSGTTFPSINPTQRHSSNVICGKLTTTGPKKKWTLFNPDPSASYTKWKVRGKEYAIQEGAWHPCLDLDTRRRGYARVYERFISYIKPQQSGQIDRLPKRGFCLFNNYRVDNFFRPKCRECTVFVGLRLLGPYKEVVFSVDRHKFGRID